MKKPLRVSVMMIGALAVVLAAAVGVDRYLSGRHHHPKKPAPLSPAQQLALQVSLPQMTTNLKDSGLVQFTLTLQANNSATKTELTDLTPEIQDYINETMRGYASQTLEEASGVATLKNQVRSGIDHMLQSGSVTNVMFTTIVVQ